MSFDVLMLNSRKMLCRETILVVINERKNKKKRNAKKAQKCLVMLTQRTRTHFPIYFRPQNISSLSYSTSVLANEEKLTKLKTKRPKNREKNRGLVMLTQKTRTPSPAWSARWPVPHTPNKC